MTEQDLTFWVPIWIACYFLGMFVAAILWDWFH